MTERKTIRQLREERGCMQETLARRVGVGQGAVSAWERGERLAWRCSILRLADLLGISIEQRALGPADQHQHAGPQHATL